LCVCVFFVSLSPRLAPTAACTRSSSLGSVRDAVRITPFVDKLLSPLIDCEVTFGDLTIPMSAVHEVSPDGEVLEHMVQVSKPVFRIAYDPACRRQLTVYITRKTSGITRLPLTSLHENRMFRFVFVIRNKFSNAAGPSAGDSAGRQSRQREAAVVVLTKPFLIMSVEPAEGCARKKKAGAPEAPAVPPGVSNTWTRDAAALNPVCSVPIVRERNPATLAAISDFNAACCLLPSRSVASRGPPPPPPPPVKHEAVKRGGGGGGGGALPVVAAVHDHGGPPVPAVTPSTSGRRQRSSGAARDSAPSTSRRSGSDANSNAPTEVVVVVQGSVNHSRPTTAHGRHTRIVTVPADPVEDTEEGAEYSNSGSGSSDDDVRAKGRLRRPPAVVAPIPASRASGYGGGPLASPPSSLRDCLRTVDAARPADDSRVRGSRYDGDGNVDTCDVVGAATGSAAGAAASGPCTTAGGAGAGFMAAVGAATGGSVGGPSSAHSAVGAGVTGRRVAKRPRTGPSAGALDVAPVPPLKTGLSCPSLYASPSTSIPPGSMYMQTPPTAFGRTPTTGSARADAGTADAEVPQPWNETLSFSLSVNSLMLLSTAMPAFGSSAAPAPPPDSQPESIGSSPGYPSYYRDQSLTHLSPLEYHHGASHGTQQGSQAQQIHLGWGADRSAAASAPARRKETTRS
jgi:hypothetical protein